MLQWFREVANEWAKQNIGRYYLTIIIGVVAMLLGVTIGYGLGIRNSGTGVPDHGDGAGNVREQLGQAVSHQQQITDGIKDAEHTSNAAAGTAQAIAESAHSIEAGVGEAAVLIDSSQQILGRVRNRGQAHPVKN